MRKTDGPQADDAHGAAPRRNHGFSTTSPWSWHRRATAYARSFGIRALSSLAYHVEQLVSPVSSHARRVLTEVYRTILCRDPDPSEYAHHLEQLLTGELSMERVRAVLEDSDEHRLLVEPLAAEVSNAYTLFLFREPTQEEVTYHISRFRNRFPTWTQARAVVSAGAARTYLGIRPFNIEMDITNQCNLRCVMCYFSDDRIHQRRREDLAPQDFARIAEQLFPLAHRVSLSIATEPLIHRHFPEFLAIAKQYEIPKLYINTNGLLLNHALIEDMIRGNLHAIGISLDAATKATYERIRVGSTFEKVISNIQAINRAKRRMDSPIPRVTLNFVMMRANIQELPAFIRLARDLEVHGVNAVHVVPYAAAANESESLVKDRVLANRILDEARALAAQYSILFYAPRNFGEPVAGVAHEESSSPRYDVNRGFDLNLAVKAGDARPQCCPFPWHFVGIDSSGRVVPCGWWYQERPMGNIKERAFEDIWSSEPYRTLRREHLEGRLRSTCQSCPAAGVGDVDDPNAFAAKVP